MKKIFLLFTLSIFLSCEASVFSCGGQSINGYEEKENLKLSDGITTYKGTLYTGEIFGNYKNGKLNIKTCYKDGKKQLAWKYYDNGQLERKAIFKDGIIELEEEYYENGKLSEEVTYENGKKVMNKAYHKNGKLNFIGHEKNGKADGIFEVYYENGELEYKAIYKDGKEVEVIIKDGKKVN